MEHGIIKEFHGSWGSGLGHLVIEDIETGLVQGVPCDNGPTVRALESAFGNVIGDAHDVSQQGGHVGQEIYWDWDEFGMTMGGFTPAAEL
jgi:hypothetical protein